MKKGWKRALIALLCLVMMLALVPGKTQAAVGTGDWSNGWGWWDQKQSTVFGMRRWGCLVVAQAKLLCYAGIVSDSSFNPDIYYNWLVGSDLILSDMGMRRPFSGPTYYAQAYGKTLSYTQESERSDAKIWANINAGKYTILGMTDPYEHWVLVNNEASKELGKIRIFQSWGVDDNDNEYGSNPGTRDWTNTTVEVWTYTLNTTPTPTTFSFDINGLLDGNSSSNISGYGTLDLYFNGGLDQAGVTDYNNPSAAINTAYAIRNVKPASGKVFAGFTSGLPSGTITQNTEIVMEFRSFNAADWVKKHSPAKESTYGGHTYRYFSNKVTWTEAKQICNKLGGHPVTIGSKAENDFVSGLISSSIWLGTTDEKQEGTFMWVDGSAMSYSNWAAGEPNNDTSSAEGCENYVSMYGPDSELIGQWNDVFNYAQYGFICEVDTQTYTVSYDANGGTGAPGQQTKTQGQALTLSSTKPTRADVAAGSYTITLDPNGGKVSRTSLTAARTTSYTFRNWNTSKDGSGTTYASGGTYTVDAPVTLFAQWDSAIVTDSVVLPSAMQDGFVFDGWYTAVSGGNQAGGAGDDYTPAGNGTLYAHWSKDHTHTPGKVVKENEVAPTCTTDGSYDEVTYCTGCGAELNRVHKTIAKLSHTAGQPVKENKVQPSCTADGGFDEVCYCANCHTELSRVHTTVPKLGHNPGQPVKENEVPATTETEGSYDEVTYCTRCGAELSRVHKTTGKLPPAHVTFKTQPKSVTKKSGSKVTFKVKVKEKHVTYQWYGRAPGAQEWTKMPGGTKASFKLVVSKAYDGWQFRCGVTNDGEAFSNTVTLTVNPQPPKFSSQPKDIKAKVGAKVKFRAKASGKNVLYQWYYRTSETGEWILIDGATKDKYEFKATADRFGWQFYCRAWNADGEIYSKVATLRQK